METMKKLLKSGHTLIFTSIVLLFAIFVYLTNNFGYGWFANNNQATANGMQVDVLEPGSPIESYEFYKVHHVKSKYENEMIYDTYAFVALGAGEVAEMKLGHYDKLERPAYHILLHISLKEGAETLFVDANINDGTYTIDKNQLLGMVQNNMPIGLSAVMEFYVIRPEIIEGENGAEDEFSIKWVEDYAEKKDDKGNPIYADVFVFDSHYLYEDKCDTFDQPNQNELSFTSVSEMFKIENLDSEEDLDVDDDGFDDIFIFMTYSAERVNLLQGTLQNAATAEGLTNDLPNMQFVSDFALRVSGTFDDGEEQE